MKTDSVQTHVINSFFNTLKEPYAANNSLAPVDWQRFNLASNISNETDNIGYNALQKEAIKWLFDKIQIERETAYGISTPKRQFNVVEKKDALFSSDNQAISASTDKSSSIQIPTDTRKFEEVASTDALVKSSQLPSNEELPDKPFKEYKAPMVRRFSCTYCNLSFLKNFGLTQHIAARHTGHKPFVCHCGKRFDNEKALERHKPNHTKENKRYACTQCTKRFAHKQDLSRHIRLHQGESLYKCKYCEKRFDRLCQIEVHVNTHIKRKAKS